MVPSKRVLIVDDSAEQRRALREIALASGRYAVVGEADNATEALRLYRAEKPDLVLLDIVMPGIDGIQAARQLIGIDPTARIIMVTSGGQEALVMESLVAGAIEFVARPFAAESVIGALDRVAGVAP